MLKNKKIGKNVILKSLLGIMLSILTIVNLKSGLMGTTLSASVSDSGKHPSSQSAQSCNREPTGVDISDYWLDFVTEGMPDPNLNGLPARIRVHRIKPVYANGKCQGVPNLAVVLIHGRSAPGSVSFDLRHPGPSPENPQGGGELSVQEALARAGIDTFAPDLIGYGLSSRLALDDPFNASLPGYNPDGTCPLKIDGDGNCSPRDDAFGSPECCDQTRPPGVFPLNQQARYLGDVPSNTSVDGLGVNPLRGVKRPHSSRKYFASPDVFARNILQVIDDAIAKAQPRGNKVILLGYSFGGPTTARALYLLGKEADHKVSRAIFMASVFNIFPGVSGEINLPTEEKNLSPAELSTSFPLSLSRVGGWSGVPGGPGGQRDQICTGRVITNTPEEFAKQTLALDPDFGAKWGGSDPNNPTGLLRSPTFTRSGWNPEVAATFTVPTLILQGIDDTTVLPLNSNSIFNALTSVENKVLVQVDCASHQLQYEGCSLARCNDGDPSTTPYGQDSQFWAGPHRTVAAAIAEWVKYGTFDGSECGQFFINASGVVSSKTPCQVP
jgi:pimeloyl-ACP methyl ester carboxylesterase